MEKFKKCLFLLGALFLSFVLFMKVNQPALRQSEINNLVLESYKENEIPKIEKALSTNSLNDIKIDHIGLHHKSNWDIEGYCYYDVDFTYTSQKLDTYYEAAIESETGAKKLYDIMLDFNAKKNSYNYFNKNFQLDYKGEVLKISVEKRDDSRFTLIMKTSNHTYEMANEKNSQYLKIDGNLLYRRR